MCNAVCSPNLSSCLWILNSGANDHVFSSLKLFSSYYRIKPVEVSLPNENCVMVHYAGNIIFQPLLYLNHVLYVPEFSLNLISISILCQSLRCFAIFIVNQCVL